MKIVKFGTALIGALVLSATATAQPAPAEETATAKLVKQAMASDIRSDDERERDSNRKPAETLDFFGLEPDMKVMEIFAGAGWYTKILAPVLAEEGELSLAIGATRIAPKLTEWGLDKVVVVEEKGEFKPTDQYGVFEITGVEFPKNEYDMVLTFRNYHNLTPETRGRLNEAVFKSLKRGGVYGIVDHTRRHMEPVNSENWRRADPVEAIKEALDAGFEFAGYSDIHYRPDDELRYDTARKSVSGYSDRFTFKFVKPKR